jgi:hypothetical protein
MHVVVGRSRLDINARQAGNVTILARGKSVRLEVRSKSTLCLDRRRRAGAVEEDHARQRGRSVHKMRGEGGVFSRHETSLCRIRPSTFDSPRLSTTL